MAIIQGGYKIEGEDTQCEPPCTKAKQGCIIEYVSKNTMVERYNIVNQYGKQEGIDR